MRSNLSSVEGRSIYKHIDRWGSVLMLWICFAQMITSMSVKSAVYDEPAHLFRGCLVWRYQSYTGRPIHWLTGIPCLLAPELPEFDEPPRARVQYRNAFFDRLGFSLDLLLFSSRVLSIHLTILLGALLYRWGKMLIPRMGGVLTLAMFTYEPNLLAHGRLVTTDIAPTLLFTLCFYLYIRALNVLGSTYRKLSDHNQWHKVVLYFGGAAIALWLALLSKPTASVLLPLLGLITLSWIEYRKGWRHWLPQLGLFFTLSIMGIGLYGLLSGVSVGEDGIIAIFEPLILRVAAALRRLLQPPQDARGWPAYMLGQRSFQGWRHYFLILFLVKTPLPLIISYPIGMVSLIRERKWQLLIACSLPLWMFFAYTQLAVNIGYRHMLPAVPLVILAGAYGLLNISSGRYRFLTRPWLVGFFLLWIGWGSLRIYPDYLAYFNEVAGGPAHGIDFFSDSNLDWGQDLKKLHRWIKVHDIEWVYLSYFGSVEPAMYGINYRKIETDLGRRYLNNFTPIAPPPGIYAISATHLTGQYLWRNPSVFSWFKQQTPVAKIGYSIWVFVVPPDPDPPRWAAACSLPSSDPMYILEDQKPLNYINDLHRGIGKDAPIDRLIRFDCSRGWPLVPSESETGWLLVPSLDGETSIAMPPVGDYTLAYRQKNYQGDLLYEVFRWHIPSVVVTIEDPTTSVSAEGTVRLVSTQIATEKVAPGEMVVAHLVWQVMKAPQYPISFMAHLQHTPTGQTVAVDDGNAIPLSYWQPGDSLLQVHHLSLPSDAPTGHYVFVVGVYTIPEIELLPLSTSEGDLLGETAIVAEIIVD